MKVESRSGAEERSILIGMVTDKAVLARVASKWDGELFSSRWCNLIARWCVKYYQKYQDAPNKAIEGMFESWSSKKERDKNTIGLVENFLDVLSDEYEAEGKPNSDYLIDLAGAHFNKVKYQKLVESIQGDLDSGDLSDVEDKISNFSRVEMGAGSGIDVLRDKEAIRQAFEHVGEPIVEYKGALGVFLEDVFERDGFVAFTSPEKKGKSWWLLDLAWRAALQERKVAFFAVGDMTQNQMLRRFMVRASRHPMKLKSGFPGQVKYPKRLVRDPERKLPIVKWGSKEFKKPIDVSRAWKSCDKILRTKVRTEEVVLNLSCHPNRTIDIFGIESVLKTWEREGWFPDIIVIDYADVLAPPRGSGDLRDQINTTWQMMRSLSQSRHCLVVTATQADAASYRVETLSKTNFTDDKRKHAHVTGMLGVNQTPEEKEHGLYRINFLDFRESDYLESRCVYTAGCLALANPAIKSCF